MVLEKFEGQDKKEIPMIEVAKEILNQENEYLHFNDLLQKVANYLELSDNQVDESMSQFYTDLNIDGGFISFGEQRWALREWYAIDAINEESTHQNEAEDAVPVHRDIVGFEDGLDSIEESDEDLEVFSDEIEEDDIRYEGEVEEDDLVEDEERAELRQYEEDLEELEVDEPSDEEMDFDEDDDEYDDEEDDDDLD